MRRCALPLFARLGAALFALTVASISSAQSVTNLDGMTVAGLSPDGNTVLGQTLGQACTWTKAGGIKPIPILASSSIAKFSSTHGEQVVGEVSTPTGTGVFWWNGSEVTIVSPRDSDGNYNLIGCDATGDYAGVMDSRNPLLVTKTKTSFLGSSIGIHPLAVGMAADGALFGNVLEYGDLPFYDAVLWNTNGSTIALKRGSSLSEYTYSGVTSYFAVGRSANNRSFIVRRESASREPDPPAVYANDSFMGTYVGEWRVGDYNESVGIPTLPSADGNGLLFSAGRYLYLQDVHSSMTRFDSVLSSQGMADLAGMSVIGMSGDGLTFAGKAPSGQPVYVQIAPVTGNAFFYIVPFQPNTIPYPGVLKSPIGWPATAVLVSQPAHGTVNLNADGSFSYTPTGDYIGRDQFQVRNGYGGGSAKAGTVVLHVGVPKGITTTQPSVYGASGTPVRGSVTLNFTTKAPVTLSLKSTHPEAASVPPSVVVPAGASSASFPITSHAVDGDTTATIVATLDTVSVTCSLKVMRNVVSTFSAPQILANVDSKVNGHIYLTGPAGPAGIHVLLSVLNGVLRVSASVNVPPGERTVAVPMTVLANVSRIVGIKADGRMFPVNVVGIVRARSGNTFSPISLTVSRPPPFGTSLKTTVCWYNADSIPHTVTPDSRSGPSSDAQYPDGVPPGKYFYFTPDPTLPSGATLYYHCRFKGHPGDGSNFGAGMSARLVVK